MTDRAEERRRLTDLAWRVQQDVAWQGSGASCVVGDLLTFRATAAFDVEWLLLEIDQAGCATLIAADIDPRVGTRDVAVPPEAACGALVVRCDVSIEVPWAAVGSHGQPSGSVPAATLDAVRRLVHATDAQGRSLLSHDVESESSFSDHLRRMANARRSLLDVLVPLAPVASSSGRSRLSGAWVAVLAMALGMGVGVGGSKWVKVRENARTDARLAARAGIVASPVGDIDRRSLLIPDEITRGGVDVQARGGDIVAIELQYLPDGRWVDLRVELRAVADDRLLWHDATEGSWWRDSVTVEVPSRWLVLGQRYRFDVFAAQEAVVKTKRIARYTFEVGPNGGNF